jgi:effector-binding domain-containing protein
VLSYRPFCVCVELLNNENLSTFALTENSIHPKPINSFVMKFLKGLLVVVVILVIAFVIMGMSADSEYRVERTVTIDACCGDVFANISDFHSWNEWGPWVKMDPNCEYAYEGDMAAIGMKSIWNGDPGSVGAGSMTCSEVSENGIVYEMIRDGIGASTGSMTMEKVEDGYLVTWASYGVYGGFFEKVIMNSITSMEKIVAPMFEDGLGNLKTRVEALPRSDFEPQSAEMEEFHYIGKKMAMNAADLTPEVYQAAFMEIFGAIMAAGTAPHDTMKSMTVWHEFDQETMDGVFEIAMPVVTAVEASEGLTVGTIAAGSCMVGEHVGSYDSTGETWTKMEGYMDCNRVEVTGYPIEMYMTGPADGELDPNNYVTHIIYPAADTRGSAEGALDTSEEGEHHHHEDGEGDHDHEEGEEGHGEDHDHDAEETEDHAG